MTSYYKPGSWNVICRVCDKSNEEVEFFLHSNGKPRKQCKTCFYSRRGPLSPTAKSRRYKNRDIEKALEHTRNWRKNNLEYDAHRAALYRASKTTSTPLWADLSKIKEIYNSCPKGFHVDHIIPLRGSLVCGLHVENNLQHLPASDNHKKRNSYVIL